MCRKSAAESGPLCLAAYATDDYLRSLDLPDGITYDVMLNAKEAVAGGDPAAVIDTIFAPTVVSPVDLVCIAANFGTLAELCPGVHVLSPFSSPMAP